MKRLFSVLAVLLSMAVLLAACSGGGGGGGGSTPPPSDDSATTTTVSGKVTLSSTVSGKPTYSKLKAMATAPKGKPGSKTYYATKQTVGSLGKTLYETSPGTGSGLGSANVYLYNADHPEWLCPVAKATTDSDGNYTLTELDSSFVTCNGNAYTAPGPIPVGKYTLLAHKPGGFDPILGITTPAVVAVQTVVKDFAQTLVSGNDLVAQPSDATPSVKTMFGVAKNTDGTLTWGSSATKLPANAAIQITFSNAMARGSLTNGIEITPSVSGKWSLSADWLTATFYPASGVTLTAGTTYTIKVKGSDTSTTQVTNVYGNALAKTSTGTFTAEAVDSIAPTAEWESPTTLEMASAVDVTKPIRIKSNKQLDVNGLVLEGKISGVSSLGAKPGVLYIGKNTAGYFVYEFVLGEPLKLGTAYDLKVSGGKGLNGKIMNDLTGSLITISAAESTGISADADTTTQTAQAQVKDVFGKWVRSFNDRNITQLQSVMSGDFYFEYDVSKGIDDKTDINRDGRYSMKEFTDMIANQAFPQWEYCGTTMSGDVVGTINVVGGAADFEFKLSATSLKTTMECAEAAPDGSLYATLQQINGAWVIVRTSEGIDTRSKQISFPKLMTTKLSQSGSAIQDGGIVTQGILDNSNPATFSWEAVSGVASYVALIIDSRNPDKGMAVALPTTITSIPTNKDPVTELGGKDVSSRFGFNSGPESQFQFVEGGEYYWEVIGFGSISYSDIANKTDFELLKDIAAISALKRFTIDGVYKELKVSVSAGGTTLTFNENYNGYDAGSAGTATITVTTPNLFATMANISVNGHTSKFYQPAFTCNSTDCTATQIVDLNQGWNWIWIDDGTGSSGGTTGTYTSGLSKQFSMQTTGGIEPVIKVSSVTNQSGVALSGDSWGYYDSTKNSSGTTITGATKVILSGSVTDSAITQLNVNVWNDKLGAYTYVQTPVTSQSFTVTVEIYKGDNWINISDNNWTYNAHAGVYTDTGTVWVPPFTITGITDGSTDGAADKNYDWGNSSDWTAVPRTDYTVTISGKLKTPLATSGNCGDKYNYNIWSDGSSSWGELKALTDGSFSLNVELYNGWNYVSFNDPKCNWYGVNIYTESGKVVIKPTITKINDTAYTAPTTGGMGSASISTCLVKIDGTALTGNVQVNWNGYDGANYYWESQTVQATGTAGSTGTFTVTMPVVSGSGSYNYLDIYDANWKWTGVQVTTTGTCLYTPPVTTVSTVKNASGTDLAPDAYGNYDAAASETVTVSGTSSRPGATITASLWVCSTEKRYVVTSSQTDNGSGAYDWTISNIYIYGSQGSNYISIGDGFSSTSVNVYSTNSLTPPPPPLKVNSVVSATLSYSGCGWSEWNTGTSNATTVTISGTTTASDGEGHYSDPTGGNKPFTIVSGAFSFNVNVYHGYNNIYLYDTAWNYTNVSVYTENGNMRPQFVKITDPANNATGITGTRTVTGTITDPNTSGYKPGQVNAWTSVGVKDSYGNCSYTSTNFTTDTYQQQTYGYKPITFDGTNFSFSPDFGDGSCDSYISVDAYDNTLYIGHGTSISVNTTYTATENWWKPGTKDPVSSKSKAVNSEMMRKKLTRSGR